MDIYYREYETYYTGNSTDPGTYEDEYDDRVETLKIPLCVARSSQFLNEQKIFKLSKSYDSEAYRDLQENSKIEEYDITEFINERKNEAFVDDRFEEFIKFLRNFKKDKDILIQKIKFKKVFVKDEQLKALGIILNDKIIVNKKREFYINYAKKRIEELKKLDIQKEKENYKTKFKFPDYETKEYNYEYLQLIELIEDALHKEKELLDIYYSLETEKKEQQKLFDIHLKCIVCGHEIVYDYEKRMKYNIMFKTCSKKCSNKTNENVVLKM